MKNAIDCKILMTTIAVCHVGGVQYGPGAPVSVYSEDSADRLVAAGAAIRNKATAIPEAVTVQSTKEETTHEQPSERPKLRLRSSAGKQRK